MGFIIKLSNKRGRKPPLYFAALPTETTYDQDSVKLREGGYEIHDFENTPFDSLEEASEYPYPTAEAAALVISSFPPTEDTEFEIVDLAAQSSRQTLCPD